ncbi:MAG: glycosyltransferase [Gammaproteobacteria bacterium]|nr:glycosyltransferase [Gammaproteobacteria bacterium]
MQSKSIQEQELPKVSVLITTFNRAHLLPRCLESVYGQNYDNLEVIVVDDASTDETPNVIDDFKKQHDDLIVVTHEKNMGNARARNSAWRAASGEFIAFMDDDDYWLDNDKLARQVEVFKTSAPDIGICCTSVSRIRGDNSRETAPDHFPGDIRHRILRRNGVIFSSTVMVPYNVIEQVGGFDENKSRGVDSDFYRAVICFLGYKVKFLELPTTCVDETEAARITPIRGISGLRSVVYAHLYLLWKYRTEYFKDPKASIYRIKLILKTFYRIMRRIE